MRKYPVYCWLCCAAAFALAAAGADDSAADLPPARARVVIVENPGATAAFVPQPQIVQGMVDRGILKFTGKSNLKQAWRAIVSPKDVVGIKVYSEPGANSGTRPAVVAAVIEGLLKTGLAP